MALYARYPNSRRRGLGKIFSSCSRRYLAATAAGFADGWQTALGAVFISGVLFLIMSLVGLREMIFDAVSPSLKNGIAVGIKLLIAFIWIAPSVSRAAILKDPGTGGRS